MADWLAEYRFLMKYDPEAAAALLEDQDERLNTVEALPPEPEPKAWTDGRDPLYGNASDTVQRWEQERDDRRLEVEMQLWQ